MSEKLVKKKKKILVYLQYAHFKYSTMRLLNNMWLLLMLYITQTAPFKKTLELDNLYACNTYTSRPHHLQKFKWQYLVKQSQKQQPNWALNQIVTIAPFVPKTNQLTSNQCCIPYVPFNQSKNVRCSRLLFSAPHVYRNTKVGLP